MIKNRTNTTNLLSRECLLSALLRLVQDKPLSAISVSELCSVAGVSRMTFYRNYSSIESIFTDSLDEILSRYSEDDLHEKNLPAHYYSKENMIHYFTYLKENRLFLSGLIKCGFEVYFLTKIKDFLVEKWGSQADEFSLIAFAGSLYSTFLYWSAQNYSTPLDELAERMERLYS